MRTVQSRTCSATQPDKRQLERVPVWSDKFILISKEWSKDLTPASWTVGQSVFSQVGGVFLRKVLHPELKKGYLRVSILNEIVPFNTRYWKRTV